MITMVTTIGGGKVQFAVYTGDKGPRVQEWTRSVEATVWNAECRTMLVEQLTHAQRLMEAQA